MRFSGKGILLDIEGTTSSVRFVYDVMFPLVRRDLAAFLERQWDDVEVRRACEQIALDASQGSLEAWCGADPVSCMFRFETGSPYSYGFDSS